MLVVGTTSVRSNVIALPTAAGLVGKLSVLALIAVTFALTSTGDVYHPGALPARTTAPPDRLSRYPALVAVTLVSSVVVPDVSQPAYVDRLLIVASRSVVTRVPKLPAVVCADVRLSHTAFSTAEAVSAVPVPRLDIVASMSALSSAPMLDAVPKSDDASKSCHIVVAIVAAVGGVTVREYPVLSLLVVTVTPATTDPTDPVTFPPTLPVTLPTDPLTLVAVPTLLPTIDNPDVAPGTFPEVNRDLPMLPALVKSLAVVSCQTVVAMVIAVGGVTVSV